MDLADQKQISQEKFNVDKLKLLAEDLRTELLASSKWTTLMSIKDDNGVDQNILDHYILITKDQVRSARRTRSHAMELCCLNMYIALWRSLSGKVKTKLLLSKKLIGTDGPTLLCVLLRTYQGTASQMIQVTMRELDNIKRLLSDTHKNNIESFCDYG